MSRLLSHRIPLILAWAALIATPCVSRADRHPFKESKSLSLRTIIGTPYTGPNPDSEPSPAALVTYSAVQKSGTTSASLQLILLEFPPQGVFTVSTTSLSSSSTFILGTIAITGTGNVYLYNPQEWWNPTPVTVGYANATLGGTNSPLPPGFDPFDVASLIISDSNGNLIAEGDLATNPDLTYTAIHP